MDGRFVLRVMNAHPNPKRLATSKSQSIQTTLQFESPDSEKRIPDERRSECIALLRELIEAVAGYPTIQAGGAND
jgi:hypothetical protein